MAIPQVEPKDWHHPRVLSDIISPLYTPTIYPIYSAVCRLFICVCCVHIVYTYVLYTIYTEIQRHTDHTPHTPYTPTHHNTININKHKIIYFLLFIKVNFNFGAEKFFKKFFSPYTKTPPLKAFWCLCDSCLVPQKW